MLQTEKQIKTPPIKSHFLIISRSNYINPEIFSDNYNTWNVKANKVAKSPPSFSGF